MNTNDTYKKLAYSLRILQLGETPKARRLLEKLAGEAPENADVYNALGALCYDEGDLDAARAALHACVALAPEHPLANATLGELALRRKDGAAAARHFEITLRSKAAGIERIQQWVKVLWTLASAPSSRGATNESASMPR